MPHAETFNPKLVPRTDSAQEFNEALDNLQRLWRGLDDHATSEFRALLKRYLQGELTMSEWRDIVHSIVVWRFVAHERGTLSPERSEDER